MVGSALANAGPRVAASVTRDEQKHKLFIKVVNGNSDGTEISDCARGSGGRKASGHAGDYERQDAQRDQHHHPRRQHQARAADTIQVAGTKFEYTFVPYSVNVMELSY